MTLPELLTAARDDCAALTSAARFDRWWRTCRPAAMALHRKDGLFQGSHLNAWLKIADMFNRDVRRAVMTPIDALLADARRACLLLEPA